MNTDRLATKLLRRARWRLAIARWLLTPMIVALWLVAAYAVFLMVAIPLDILRHRSGSVPGSTARPAPAGIKTDQADPSSQIQSGQHSRFPFTFTEKGKTYRGEEARKKLGQVAMRHGLGRGKNDEEVGEQFAVGLVESVGHGLMLLFVAAALAFFALAIYLSFFFLPFLLTLPLSLGLSLFWLKPGRVLVLRPFRKDETSPPLRKIIARNVAGFGHTYTLADADIKVPLFVRLPMLVGQLSFFAFHRRKVRKASHIESLAKSVRQRIRRNLNWCISPGRVFPVASDNARWQECVQRLSALVDAILFDLSDVDARPNLLWELDLCARKGLADRVVFLVGAGAEAGAEEYLKSRHWPGPVADRLFVYDRSRLAEQEPFRSVIASLVAHRIQAESTSAVSIAAVVQPSDDQPVGDLHDGPIIG